MKKRAWAFWGICAIIIIGMVTLAFFPSVQIPTPISISSLTGTPAPDQVKYLRYLELGFIDEQSGQLTQAQGNYLQASLAGDAEIARIGQENYRRLVTFQQNPFYKTQTSLDWIKSPFIWITLALLILLLTILFYPNPVSYRIVPFNDLTKDQVGKGIHSLVVRNLNEIRQTYQQAQNELTLDLDAFRISPSSQQTDALTDLMGVFASLKIGPIPVPLDKIRSALEKWRSRNEYLLGGDFYLAGNTYYLDAAVSQMGKEPASWFLPTIQPSQPGEAVQTLSLELSYRFLFFLSGGKSGFQSWETLKTWSECLRIYCQASASSQMLEETVKTLAAAQSIEPGNRLIAFLEGLIFSRIEQYTQARTAFNRVTQGSDLSDDLSLMATYRFGQTYYLNFEPGGFARAIQFFEEVRQILTDKELNERQKQASALALCGLAVIWAHQLFEDETGDPQKILKIETTCMDALDIAGTSPEVVAASAIARGIAYQNVARPDEALKEFEHAVTIRRNYPGALIFEAVVLSEMVHSVRKHVIALDKQAEEAFKKADIEQKNRLMHELNQRAAAAVQLFQESINTGLPGGLYARKKLVELLGNWGRACAVTGNLEQGLDHYNQGLSLDPFQADLWDNMAYRIVSSGRNDSDLLAKAEAAARKAVDLTIGGNREAHYLSTLAEVLYKHGKYKEAMEHVDMALGLTVILPRDRDPLNNLRLKIQEEMIKREK